MLKRWLLFSFILSRFVGVSIQAQHKVRVLDWENDIPLVGVNVIANKPAITNEEGFFHLEDLGISSDSDTITLSHIGYETTQFLGKEIKNKDTVYLVPKSYPIEELRVSKERIQRESVEWDQLAPLKYEVFAFGAALVGDSIYVIGVMRP